MAVLEIGTRIVECTTLAEGIQVGAKAQLEKGHAGRIEYQGKSFRWWSRDFYRETLKK